MGKGADLAGSCAIVTGAGGGIGREFALRLALRGCGLILVDISIPGMQETERLIKQSADVDVAICPLDLTKDGIAEELEAFCLSNRLDPDILINNAGIFSFMPVTDLPPAKLEAFMALHVKGVTILSRWFANRRLASKKGYILNMSSMSCWMPMPGLAMYAATKAYIRVFSRALHYELKDSGIGVTVACPGGIATDLFGLPPHLKKLAVNIKVLDTPASFAAKAINRMLKKRKQYINGWLNRISILFVASTPTPVRMLIKRQLLDKGITR